MWRRCVAALATLFLTSSASLAQDVTLMSRDGGVQVSGNLLGFDGEFYRVDTVFGEMTLDGTGVDCDGPGCPDLENFVARMRFSGAAALGQIMLPSLLAEFAKVQDYTIKITPQDVTRTDYTIFERATGRPVARVSVQASTTDQGFRDLLADDTDAVLSLREIRPAERDTARDAGLGDLSDPRRSRVLALDAVVAVVSPGNPIRAIAPLDLAAVFAGEIDNWQALGGPDAPIALHLPDASTGLGQSVEDRLLAPANLNLTDRIERHVISLDVADAVVQDPFAIGIASYAETGNAQVLALTGACGFEVVPSRRTIKTEDYPLSSPIFLYLPARRLPKFGRDFMAFLRSPTAQLVIRNAGFVDQTPEEIDISLQGRRVANAIAAAGPEVRLEELQRMTSTLSPLRRLTTSFRFETGSARLDAQSRENVLSLAYALELGTYDTRRLLFVGFSDGDGAAAPNRDISLRRAEAVRRAVSEAAETADFDRVTLDVDAFGEASPLACDDSQWGRQANRRVEVWVR